jgi:hypothetical protein
MVDFAKYLNRNKPRSNTEMPKDNPFGKPAASDDTNTFEVDLPSEAEENAKWIVPAAEYQARVVGCEKKTSNSGNPMIEWEFELTGPKEYKGRTFKSWTALTPSAMWKVREVLEALGLGEGGKKAKFTKKDAIGKACTLVIEDDEYEGKARSSVGEVKPPAKPAQASSIPV